ncbi:substrate-binding protein domain-containing protein, partial [Devosia limi DSM 17137]
MNLKSAIVLGTIATLAMGGTSYAQDSFTFAVVPKAMNNPFFDLTRDGCEARAAELGNVTCTYIGPVEHEAATQAQIIEDLITQGVDGLAISVSDIAAATTVIDRAVAAGIVVITFDSDAPDSKRSAYVGTDNKQFGTALGELLLQVKQPWASWIECGVRSGDGIEDCYEFADGSDHGELEGFSARPEPLVEAAEHGILDLDGAEHSHVGDVAQVLSAATASPIAIGSAGLARIGGHAQKGRSDLGGDLSKLGHVGQQG